MLNRQTLAIIVPILVLLLPMSYALAEEWQKPMSKISLGEVEPQTESAVRNLIEANQILKRASNSSTYVAAGSVVDVVYKLEQNGGIRTYANISIAFPIKGDLALHEISTVWYEGGEFGEWSLTIYRLYPYFPGDAVTLPSVFELRVGMSILFFAFQQSDGIELLLYVLVPSEYLLCNNPVDSNRDDVVILQESQPTANVTEASGYGFGWNGLHRDWVAFPVLYNIDPDGTPDISGTEEFSAI